MTTQHFLFIFLSLYSIQSYGMEKEIAHAQRKRYAFESPNIKKDSAYINQQNKHIKNFATRTRHKSTITRLCTLINGKSADLTTAKKDELNTALQRNIQSLDECYSVAETWSEDDLDAYNDGKQTIKSLQEILNQ